MTKLTKTNKIAKWFQKPILAGVAELADAQASGACSSNTVWVQVPSPAFPFSLLNLHKKYQYRGRLRPLSCTFLFSFPIHTKSINIGEGYAHSPAFFYYPIRTFLRRSSPNSVRCAIRIPLCPALFLIYENAV